MEYKNSVVLLAGTKETRKALYQQLTEIIGDFIHIHSFSVEEKLPSPIKNKLVILSSELITDEVQHVIETSCTVIAAKRTINYLMIDQLLFLPNGAKALYVNDFPETVIEGIHTLKELGIDHIEYIPCYPNRKVFQKTKVAITPGEVHLIPDYVEEIVNIGPRLIDISTIFEILNHLQLLDQKGAEISNKYNQKIIDLSKKLASTMRQANDLNKHLKRVVDGVNDGILAVRFDGTITVFNEIMEKFTSVAASNAIGNNIDSVISNKQLVEFILSEQQTEDNAFSLGSYDTIVHRFCLQSEETIVATFKNPHEAIEMERTLRRELVKKGYYAKYTFADIIGRSKVLQDTKETAAKLAKTDLTVLIQGESGTGKELFASAIHNQSIRNKSPFLAVNFSALTEDLMESELFGYEEGAFTGAKKGGKKGLFEQANGGTIFLDEIGDISLKLQARLLRVLQEKEIMRIGGNKIIPVDVRVIAATNKDLLRMIHEGVFREDLYHRLKVLFLHLPELRNRREDIEFLIQHFIKKSGRTHIKINIDVIDQLMQYQWFGNVRELKNSIDYMLAVCDGNVITVQDIPNKEFFQNNTIITTQQKLQKSIATHSMSSTHDKNELIRILQTILNMNEAGQPASRKKIELESQSWSTPLTNQQVRHRLNILEEKEYITKGRGRAGTMITETGKRYLDSVLMV
ncbi:AAA family ATPase [Bacillus sp. HMF5848]|nr:sigma 54-interacting transcriptional regulator [Bacillus sp. HMF5848]RSK27185.1 AAA family ATPase [Bacillus sp. HMF5848]